MGEREYSPVPHRHDEFMAAMSEREGFVAANAALEECDLVRELLAAAAYEEYLLDGGVSSSLDDARYRPGLED